MADTYPYVLNNGKIGAIFSAIENAAKPAKFSYEFLKKIGFGSSNDRAFVSLFRHLSLISGDNVPTSLFDEIRDPARRPYALGEAIRDSYRDLFSINTSIHKASDADIRAAISRVTGKDADYVNRAYNTFKNLLALAKFDQMKQKDPPALSENSAPANVETPVDQSKVLASSTASAPAPTARNSASLHYNIQIHLPATTDISVYNAVFRSLRDTLGIA